MTWLHSWEVAAWLGVLAGWAATRWGWPRWKAPLLDWLPERLGQPMRRLASQGLSPRGARLLDLGLTLACVVLVGVPLWRVWNLITPMRAPAGPDFEGHIAGAIAFEIADYSLYYPERYPGYSFLIALLSPGARYVPQVGTLLSMGVTILSVVGLYWTGRYLAGRAAGLVGAVLALRQPLAIDVGHSYNVYPLVTACFTSMAALLLHLVRTGAVWTAPALGLCGAVAVSCRPTAIPYVLGVLGLAAATTLLRSRRSWPVRIAMVLMLAAPLPGMNLLIERYELPVVSLEHTLLISPINMDEAALEPHRLDGFRVGQPGAWRSLVPSMLRAQRHVHPPEGHAYDPQTTASLPLVFPRTGPTWLLPLLALPLLLLLRGLKDPRRWVAVALLGLLVISASSTVRIRYEHRYFYTTSVFMPLLAVSGIALVAGPAAAVLAGAAAILLPGSGYAKVDDAYLTTSLPGAETWVMGEDVHQWQTMRWADTQLPQDVFIYDYSSIDQLPILAAVRPYRRCSDAEACARELRSSQAPAVAVLRTHDELSARIPGGSGQPLERSESAAEAPQCIPENTHDSMDEASKPGHELRPWQRKSGGQAFAGAAPPPPGSFPERAGTCWRRLCEARFDAALYELDCDPRALR